MQRPTEAEKNHKVYNKYKITQEELDERKAKLKAIFETDTDEVRNMGRQSRYSTDIVSREETAEEKLSRFSKKKGKRKTPKSKSRRRYRPESIQNEYVRLGSPSGISPMTASEDQVVFDDGEFDSNNRMDKSSFNSYAMKAARTASAGFTYSYDNQANIHRAGREHA